MICSRVWASRPPSIRNKLYRPSGRLIKTSMAASIKLSCLMLLRSCSPSRRLHPSLNPYMDSNQCTANNNPCMGNNRCTVSNPCTVSNQCTASSQCMVSNPCTDNSPCMANSQCTDRKDNQCTDRKASRCTGNSRCTDRNRMQARCTECRTPTCRIRRAGTKSGDLSIFNRTFFSQQSFPLLVAPSPLFPTSFIPDHGFAQKLLALQPIILYALSVIQNP